VKQVNSLILVIQIIDMKNWIPTFFLSMLVFTVGFSQKKQLKTFIDQKVFFVPDVGQQLEIHFQFVAYSLKYQQKNQGLQAAIKLNTAILNEKGDTLKQQAYVLESPFVRDSIFEDFYDIQHFTLPSGKYYAAIELTDLIAGNEPIKGMIDIVIPEMNNVISTSDVLMIESATKNTSSENDVPTVFTKSGYEIIPRISNFYGQELANFPFYIEIYNTDKLNDTVFALKQRIIETKTNKEFEGFSKFNKIKTAPVVPFLRSLDISKLPSGSYRFEIEVIDRNNTKLCPISVYYFERINEFSADITLETIVLDPSFQASVSDDSLHFYLASLLPIARPADSKQILQTLKSKNLENYRKHLQQFWIQTSGTAATDTWLNYKKQILLVQQLYANNFQDGYETDRGRVFLQFGQPSMIIQRETSPNEYPYEIWQYDKIKNFSNKRFIFYNPDLVNNAYRLLHSDMIGELKNPNWQKALVKRDGQSNDPDSTLPSTYGGNSNQYYRQY
jgi:GWxTD domain-containing protein